MNSFKKISGFLTVSLSLVCLTLSCNTKKPGQPSEPANRREAFICVEEGPGCWQFPLCKSFCEDLFFNKEKRQECFNWPLPLFEDFKILMDTMDNEDFRLVDPEVLKCFLEFTKEDKTFLFDKFSEEEAQEFLEEIANNVKLSFYLSEKDKGDFSIFDTLFKKIDSRVTVAIAEPLFEGENFLISILQQENRSAWIWLNDYIIYKCRKDRHCKEPLEYYCKILEDVSSNDLKDFFESQHFEGEYKRKIESKRCDSDSCSYGDLKDFNEMCDNI